MAIPEGRLATDWESTAGAYAVPEDRRFYAFVNYERGPIDIEDPGQGINYQNWTFSWDPQTGDVTATPETTGTPSVVYNIPSCSLLSCTFDQNGRVSIAWINGNAYMWWYDSVPAQKVVTDLGSDIKGITLYMDDKRTTQLNKDDMLLWYTKPDGNDGFDLFMRVQRERFQTEHAMASGLEWGNILNSGMNSNLRGQLSLSAVPPFT
jgi:hypothetical protein